LHAIVGQSVDTKRPAGTDLPIYHKPTVTTKLFRKL
jgi:hypothetical protein